MREAAQRGMAHGTARRAQHGASWQARHGNRQNAINNKTLTIYTYTHIFHKSTKLKKQPLYCFKQQTYETRRNALTTIACLSIVFLSIALMAKSKQIYFPLNLLKTAFNNTWIIKYCTVWKIILKQLARRIWNILNKVSAAKNNMKTIENTIRHSETTI